MEELRYTTNQGAALNYAARPKSPKVRMPRRQNQHKSMMMLRIDAYRARTGEKHAIRKKKPAPPACEIIEKTGELRLSRRRRRGVMLRGRVIDSISSNRTAFRRHRSSPKFPRDRRGMPTWGWRVSVFREPHHRNRPRATDSAQPRSRRGRQLDEAKG